MTAVYADSVFPVSPWRAATWLVAAATIDTCGPMRRPECSSVASIKKWSKTITNPNASLLHGTLLECLLVLFLVYCHVMVHYLYCHVPTRQLIHSKLMEADVVRISFSPLFFGDLSKDLLWWRKPGYCLDWRPVTGAPPKQSIAWCTMPGSASRSHMHNTCCAMSVCLLEKKKKLQQKCEKLTANGFACQPQERWVNLSGSRIHDARMFSTWSFQTGQEERSPPDGWSS